MGQDCIKMPYRLGSRIPLLDLEKGGTQGPTLAAHPEMGQENKWKSD